MRRRALRRVRRIVLPAVVALGAFAPQAAAVTRHVWVAAVPVRWDVVPSGTDPMTGTVYPKSATRDWTVVYRLYDRNWRHLKAGASMPGPLIRARVGDRIFVHFKNLDFRFGHAHSMHFHGVEYPFASDGSYIPGISGRGADVRPGQTFTYSLRAGKDSAGAWPYHDHSTSMDESIAGGLYGMLSILGKRERKPDREFVVALTSMRGFMAINGRAFLGNTPVFRSHVGERVRWDVMTLGDDFHTFHVHGHRWLRNGVPEDVRTIGPAESFTVTWRERAPGAWLYHCHVEGHMMAGMMGLYLVGR
jgi:FtsP/CotA-like multicopper oxidase with cupredoxin domain